MLIAITIFTLAGGAVLGLRYKVFILVPAVLFAILAVIGASVRAISAHATDLLTVDRGRARGFEHLDLAGQALIRGADASIAKNGHLALQFHK
jgi:hypothetical protein